MNIDLTPLFQALIGLLAAIITLKVIPWLKARTTAQQQALLMSTVRIAVYAAEQLYGANEGKKKLGYVKETLKSKGFDIDIDAIEAAVRELAIIENAQQQVFEMDDPTKLEPEE